MKRFFLLMVPSAVLAACGGAVPPDFGDASGGDGSTTGDGSNNGDGSMKGDGGMCVNGMFPMFDKGCTSNDVCIIELHQIDCCGTLSAIGVNHAVKTMFDTAEQMWRASCPQCGCDPGQTKAESGMTCDTSKIAVKCVMTAGMSVGKCATVCQ